MGGVLRSAVDQPIGGGVWQCECRTSVVFPENAPIGGLLDQVRHSVGEHPRLIDQCVILGFIITGTGPACDTSPRVAFRVWKYFT